MGSLKDTSITLPGLEPPPPQNPAFIPPNSGLLPPLVAGFSTITNSTFPCRIKPRLTTFRANSPLNSDASQTRSSSECLGGH